MEYTFITIIQTRHRMSPTMATVLAKVSILTKFELCGSAIPWL